MRKHSISDTHLVEFKIRIPRDLQEKIHHIALEQGETLSEFICMVLAEYIDSNAGQSDQEQSRMTLEEARLLMLELGRGLGNGQPPHNGARNHDEYLYGSK